MIFGGFGKDSGTICEGFGKESGGIQGFLGSFGIGRGVNLELALSVRLEPERRFVPLQRKFKSISFRNTCNS